MFKKILIANRGEIARRIIRTCDRLGIETVAIYSEADENSLHVREATEAYCVGKPPVAQSYLNIDEIIEIAKKTGAEAVHPGYGLLSENAQFVRACEDADLVFIGPSADVMSKMGDKLEARKTMKGAGVPVVEGIDAAIQDAEEAVKIAGEIGYPIMLKASAGGGGIGMQLIHSEEEMASAFEGNQKRAQSFFGEGTMYMERFVADAHHIEVQLIVDEHGNAVALFDRECSIQRRNQKVVEEAPSPFISSENRTMIPLRAVASALDAQIWWDGNTRTVILETPNKSVELTVESNTMISNNQNITLDSPPIIMGQRVFLPVAQIAQAFDMKVDWIKQEKKIVLTKK